MTIETPIKIIHKFKNNNRRVQYVQYIFIGTNVDEDIMSILDNIKNKSFLDCYEILSKQKLDRLENYYGSASFSYSVNTLVKNVSHFIYHHHY